MEALFAFLAKNFAGRSIRVLDVLTNEYIVKTVDGHVIEERIVALEIEITETTTTTAHLYSRYNNSHFLTKPTYEFLTEEQALESDRNTFAFTCAGHRFWSKVSEDEAKRIGKPMMRKAIKKTTTQQKVHVNHLHLTIGEDKPATAEQAQQWEEYTAQMRAFEKGIW